MLNLRPVDFWCMTPCEFNLSYEGYLEANGIKKSHMKWSDVMDIMDEHNIPMKSKSIKHGKNNG